MFPRGLTHVERSFIGPLAVYAPRTIGNLVVWRGFPTEPWSPDIDLVVATGSAAVLAAEAARAGQQYLVDPTFLARRASRGVRLSDVLDAEAAHAKFGARPPADLVARTALALFRPGPRVADVVCPHQIVISFEGDVVVDGLDPESQLRSWAPQGTATALVDAAILAACAAGTDRYDDARLLVDDALDRPIGRATPVASLIACVARGEIAQALVSLAQLPKDRAVVAGVAQRLFPTHAAAADEAREELAVLDRRALPAWPRAVDADPPLAPRATSFTALRDAAVAEAASVAADVGALELDVRATVDRYRALLASPPPRATMVPWWTRVSRDVGAWVARARWSGPHPIDALVRVNMLGRTTRRPATRIRARTRLLPPRR